MSRRRGKGLAPSLFPFLAVLVCTLGTLILLLALVAQNATDAAQQQAQAESAAAAKATQEPPRASTRLTVAAAETLLREERFRAEQLVAFRDQQTADLETRRDELTYLESQMERLQKRLRELSEEVDQTLGNQVDDTETLQAIAEIRQQIGQEQATIEELEEDANGDQPRIVIVPHKGPNGTDRRPIYLECTAEGITLWPEGSKISATQLQQSTRSANPLDAALRTIRLHALQHYGDAVPPYPLLVVRPDGIDTYGAARQAMRDWDDQFGYELIPADLKLAYHAADPSLKDRIDVAINQAAALQRVRQQQLLGGGGGGYLARGSRSVPADRLPVLSAASLDRDGRRSGFGNHREPISVGRKGYRGSPTSTTPPLVDNQGGQNGSAAGNNATTSGYQSPSYQSPPEPGTTGHARINRQWEQEMEAAARELRDSGGSGIGGGEDEIESALQSLIDPNGSGDTSISGDPEGSGTGEGSKTGAGSGTGEGDQEAIEGENSLAATGGVLNEAGENDFSGPDQTSARGGSDQTSRESQQARSGGESSAGETRRGNGGDQNMQANQNAAAGGSQSQASASESGSQTAAPPNVDPSSPAAPPSISIQPRPKTVQRQGRDWALPDGMQSAGRGQSVIRTIRAECHEGRFVLVGTSNHATEMFGLADGDVDQATLRLATAIRDRIKSWVQRCPAVIGSRDWKSL